MEEYNSIFHKICAILQDDDHVDIVAKAIEDKFSKLRLTIPPMTTIRTVLPAVAMQIPPFLLNEVMFI